MDLGFIEFCLGISIIILVSAYARSRFPRYGTAKPQPQPAGKKANAAAVKALETYERLAKEKLDVIKTALAMGYHDEELARLDARLERLIGKDKLEQIVSQGSVMPDADLTDTRLNLEIDRLKRLRQG